MANAKSKSENETREPVHHESVAEMGDMRTEVNPPALVQSGAVAINDEDAAAMFAADSGGGMEGAKQESFAIPFLIVLQKNSPQCDEASGAAIPGARQGMLYNTVTGKLYDVPRGSDDKREEAKPVRFVPCAYRISWIRWGSRKAGGGFKGELTDAQIAQMRQTGTLKDVDGKLTVPHENGSIDEKCDIVNDHRSHYGLIVNDDDSWEPVLISLTSTQIKKSKNIMAQLKGRQMKRPDGSMFEPATWASIVDISTVPEKNDKGSWMGIDMQINGKVQRRDLYEAGKSFNKAIRAGQVAENYNNLAENAPMQDGEAGGGEPSATRPDKF